jgi:hypothetical protein
VPIEFSASFKQLFTVLTPVLLWVYVTDRKVETGVVLSSLHRRESFLANRTLLALRVALINMGGNLTETRHCSGTQLAETLNSISL